MMKTILSTLISIMFLGNSFSQESNESVYSGGMLFFQPGYLVANNGHQEIEHVSFGVGGILRFYFCGFMTAGVYGGTQRAKYESSGSNNSYISIGYGGPFIGFSREIRKLRYSFSVFMGGSSIKNLHIEHQSFDVLSDAYFYKKSSIIISPILSIDYALSQRIHFTFQTVCLAAKLNNNRAIRNPILQFGVLFNR